MESNPAPRLDSPQFKREFLRATELQHLKTTFGAPVWCLDSPGVGPDGEAPPPRYTQRGVSEPHELIAEILGAIGDGKEATAYCCRASGEASFELALAKVYRAQKFRAFANESVYRAGEHIGDRRAAKAIRQRTRKGRLMSHRTWIDREWETLCALHDAGADVPAPYARTADAILMEYLGDDRTPAPLLVHCELAPEPARRLFERLIANVELALGCDRVHGDLSAFNVLYWDEKVWIIDFPQSVDARTNPNASELLLRDLTNLTRYFRRYGILDDPAARARGLWARYRRAQL